MEFALVRLFLVLVLAPQPRGKVGASANGKQLGPTDADIHNYLNSIALDRRTRVAEPNKLYRHVLVAKRKGQQFNPSGRPLALARSILCCQSNPPGSFSLVAADLAVGAVAHIDEPARWK
jgi:hypothetical protein